LGDCDEMVEADALALLLGLGVSALVASAFVASDFIASELEDPEGEAGAEAEGGVELGLELDGDGACARADDNINPLSAVESNSLFNIGKTSMLRVFFGDGIGRGFSFAAWKNRPSFNQRFNARRCSAPNDARGRKRDRKVCCRDNKFAGLRTAVIPAH